MLPTKKELGKSSKTNRDILRAGEMKLQKQRARDFTLQVNGGPQRETNNHGLNGKHLAILCEWMSLWGERDDRLTGVGVQSRVLASTWSMCSLRDLYL